ncbi:GNAT family N-acetyltransferase [Actinotalea sp. Marseille-Q4924]|uniref:GNAT family N-acetyltransferase n=1 Tax=Actinotalea sp. Marseille-Q4924 TaxID=2866571 RepID=UPI001CE4A750|nr:GNAT family N-acetyltransferase [Actinotalea sp. Marseille-Q4924]
MTAAATPTAPVPAEASVTPPVPASSPATGRLTGSVPTPHGEARLVAPGITITHMPWTHPTAQALRLEQQQEIAAIYDGQGDVCQHLPDEEMLATVLVHVDGQVAGCAALRDGSTYGAGTAELKRLFVRPAFRGRGLSGVVVGELERVARALGIERIVLETGDRLTAAIALYSSRGYDRIPNYGPYADEPSSFCFAIDLRGDA